MFCSLLRALVASWLAAMLVGHGGAHAAQAPVLVSPSASPDAVPDASPVAVAMPPRELVCQVRYASETRLLRRAAGADPYASTWVDVGARFRLRAVVLGTPTQIEHITLAAYELADGQPPAILQQLRMKAPFGLGSHIPDLTGWQHVYAPGLGRELRYGCALLPVGAAPSTPLPEPGQAPADPMPQPSAQAAPAAADTVRIANLECVIATGGQALDKPWTFRAAPRVLPLLQRHVDVVSVANNHAGDDGKAAFAEMLQRLDKAGLPYFGGGMDGRQAHRPRIIERKGVKIALLGYDEFFPRVFEAGEGLPGVAWSEDEQVAYDIRQARLQADIVIPFMHLGQEHEPRANDRQRELARLMIDAGADAVVGTHPHVVQDTETYRGKPIVYSLGNFVFDGFSSTENNTGWLLWMDVTKQGVQRWHVERARMDRDGTPHPLDVPAAISPQRPPAASPRRP